MRQHFRGVVAADIGKSCGEVVQGVAVGMEGSQGWFGCYSRHKQSQKSLILPIDTFTRELDVSVVLRNVEHIQHLLDDLLVVVLVTGNKTM